jgi:hypothetical protein
MMRNPSLPSQERPNHELTTLLLKNPQDDLMRLVELPMDCHFITNTCEAMTVGHSFDRINYLFNAYSRHSFLTAPQWLQVHAANCRLALGRCGIHTEKGEGLDWLIYKDLKMVERMLLVFRD